jgi:hypothetical protein
MQMETDNHFVGDVTTFDGRSHKVTAWKVGGVWRAHTTVDGHFIRAGGGRTLQRAIEYFLASYAQQFSR